MLYPADSNSRSVLPAQLAAVRHDELPDVVPIGGEVVVAQQGQALIALAQIRHQERDFAAADDLFTQALGLLDTSNAHDVAASAYFRFANLLEERGDVQNRAL